MSEAPAHSLSAMTPSSRRQLERSSRWRALARTPGLPLPAGPRPDATPSTRGRVSVPSAMGKARRTPAHGLAVLGRLVATYTWSRAADRALERCRRLVDGRPGLADVHAAVLLADEDRRWARCCLSRPDDRGAASLAFSASQAALRRRRPPASWGLQGAGLAATWWPLRAWLARRSAPTWRARSPRVSWRPRRP